MQLVAFNTIGLTGVEIVQARLAEFEDLLVLPGQNFTMHGQNLYRPHDYTGLDPGQIFDILNRHLTTKAGRIWMGLTKHMDEAARSAYGRERHAGLFAAGLGGQRHFFDCVRLYCESYFEACGRAAPAKHVVYYSNNVALNLPAYGAGSAPARILNVANRIDYWLASISQTRTWNCVEACKFWLVNNLYLLHFQASHPEYRSFLLEDLLDSPERQFEAICAFLGIGNRRAPGRVHGLIKPSAAIIDTNRRNALLLRQIYRSDSWFRLADDFDQWAPEFVADPSVQALLDRFARFWNSTSHTNFDWVGPVADEIAELAMARHGSAGVRDLNARFYHEYFTVHSDSHDHIDAHLHHYLGALEAEIVLPLLPYHLKVAMEYLASISRNYVFHSHSYLPVRHSDLYIRLRQPEAVEKITQFGLARQWAAMEQAIDQADQACAHLRAPWQTT